MSAFHPLRTLAMKLIFPPMKRTTQIRDWRVRSRIFLITLTLTVMACATTGEVKQLTPDALDRAKVACRIPNVRLGIDQHVSIVIPGPLLDDERKRQTTCLREQLQEKYWWDQIILENTPAPRM